ncbi:B box and SPRY domain-containing protein-like [Centropristis striata]|uniref:B box and SPRY domain-containing protein-like n=1 Tax=Centropristis striata TaxID=184440 RepID=UPI0027E09184|nr:B box and SPRY domain-containing protein-like [Centropristis striata]
MSDEQPKDPGAILCDMCTGEDRKPARKTCMKCDISMCVQHLQTHLTTPVLLQTHPLTEPMASGDAGLGGTTKCPQHGKLLQYYCLDHMTYVCVSCAIEDQHRLHNMKTFSTAHKELLAKLNDASQQALLVKVDSQSMSLEKWDKSEREELGCSSVRLIEAVTNLRDITLTSVQSSVSARMVSIRTSKSSMQAAQQEKDTFRFLQMYSQVHQDVEKAKAVDLRKGLEPGSDRDKLVQEIRQNGEKMMKQAGQFWGSLLTLVDPELTAIRSDLIFDPQLFSSGMLLSIDRRKVFYKTSQCKSSATLLISSTQAVPNIQRWMIRLSPDCNWAIGLCDKQSAMRTDWKYGHVYGLCCKYNQLSSLTTEYDDAPVSSSVFGAQSNAKVTPQKTRRVSSALISHLGREGNEAVPRPEMVEVIWNSVVSSLSFFSITGRHQREEIVTIKMSINNWDLAPFVQLENNYDKYRQRQDWKCQCGKTYYKSDRGYSDQRYGHPQQGNCSCGAVIGDVCIDVICELQ